MIKECVCKCCKNVFLGGPRAWYCTYCREDRRKVANSKYRKNKTLGLTRKLGSTDKCRNCGKEYIVESGNQLYCKKCAPIVLRLKDAESGLQYYGKNKDTINPERNVKRRKKYNLCVVCGKPILNNNLTSFCSDACKIIRKKENQKRAYTKRAPRKRNNTK